MERKKLLVFVSFVFMVSYLGIACSSDDSDKQVKETCTDGIKNQDEEEIDCGGVCDACATNYTFEEGNYRGLWNSTATNGNVFTDLKVTAVINEVSPGNYNGALYISDNYTSCCNSGDNGDGPITIKIEEGKFTFVWEDVIPGCTGQFNGTGELVGDNNLRIDLVGNDCDGDHIGNISFFK